MAEFKVGDVVQLKSGGVKMTVTEVLERGFYTTQWLSGSKLSQGHFPIDALRLVPADSEK